MKQIKTIKNRLDSAAAFDTEVNAALLEGWQLTKREVLQPLSQPEHQYTYIMLYAELERETITEAERTCENCMHYSTNPEDEPCCDCSQDADKWEQMVE